MRTIIGVALIGVFTATAAVAQDCSIQASSFSPKSGIAILAFTTSNYPNDEAIETAVDAWNNNCASSGSSFPVLTTGTCSGSACAQVSITYHPGFSATSNGGCADFQRSGAGGTINVYQWDMQGRTCADDEIATFMHEMGHALGLGDAGYNAPGQACFGSVMGNWNWGSAPSIDTDDCEEAEDGWTTPLETRIQQCEFHCTDGTCNELGDCEGSLMWDSGTNWFDPLVFDLDGDGVITTDVYEPVTFDVDADGHEESITWISGNDGLLWTDLNGNDRVDDGAELFGVGTVLPDGTKARHGYEALAMYDLAQQGGDGSGVIDQNDAIWNHLRLWRDINHDGVCDPGEAWPIHRFGVDQISLRWKRARWIDAHGNTHLLRGTWRKHITGNVEPKYGTFLIEELTLRAVSND
jgi:hypothetical protein